MHERDRVMSESGRLIAVFLITLEIQAFVWGQDTPDSFRDVYRYQGCCRWGCRDHRGRTGCCRWGCMGDVTSLSPKPTTRSFRDCCRWDCRNDPRCCEQRCKERQLTPNPATTHIPTSFPLVCAKGEPGCCEQGCTCADLKGERGRIGPKGERGEDGLRGFPGVGGEQGQKGAKGGPGFPGSNGEKGDRGQQGEPGLPGLIGLPASKGETGIPGSPGGSGREGPPGKNGNKGEAGFNGGFGPRGPRGPIGHPGMPGRIGDMGQTGLPGERGVRGIDGCKGPPGPAGGGLSGLPGPCGPPGPPGPPGTTSRGLNTRGYNGSKGEIGQKGEKGTPIASTSIYVRHVQRSGQPVECYYGHQQMWKGFSLLHVEDEGRSSSQDLGEPGSCLKRFSPMPVLFCNIHNVCYYARRTSTSYWLSTTEASKELKVNDYATEKHISPCVVCESPAPVMAMHSQTRRPPYCPTGWRELWTGYSFVMHAVGSMSGGQPLSSSGSCLEKFSPNPFIECTSAGYCHYFSDKFSFWLTTLPQLVNWNPKPVALERDRDIMERVSRCSVCIKM